MKAPWTMEKLAGNNTLAYFSPPSVSKEKKLIKFSLDSVQSPVIPCANGRKPQSCLGRVFNTEQGARYLTGEHLEVVWAEFSFLS
jgi:hypothetical protein